MSWTAGYVAEIGYTYGYYRELSPSLLSLAALFRQQELRVNREIRYLELGYGQGLSLAIHAAACPGEFWGTDFNPSHAAQAQEFASVLGGGLKTFDESFEELAERDDLPEFDIIALHGIWSWISDANRAAITRLARKRLAVGGAMFLSYNALPGWSAIMPIRHLITTHANLAASQSSGIVGRIDQSLDFAQSLVDAKALYFRANQVAGERLKKIKDQNRNYLAHEYFNADWHPLPFSAVAAQLDEAKLTFVASAHLLDHVDTLNFGAEGQQLLAAHSNVVMRETIRDYLVNQQFRRDIFMRGPRIIGAGRHGAMVRNTRIMLTTTFRDLPGKIAGPAGEANLQPEIFGPVTEALAAEDYAPKSIEQIFRSAEARGLKLPQVVQACAILVGSGHAFPVQQDAMIEAARPRSRRLNAWLIDRSVMGGEFTSLASPVIGGGVAVNRVHQLLLRSILQGHTEPQRWAADAWGVLEPQGHRLHRDGEAIQGSAENLAEMQRIATEFQDKHLPLLRRLGVV